MFQRSVRELARNLSNGLRVTCPVLIAFSEFYEPIMCVGPSMLPTLHSSDIVIIDHTSRWSKVKQGDIIAAYSPTNSIAICKRIRAMEGDCIHVGKDHPKADEDGNYKVPEGHVWLLGDNSMNSTDSREYGPVPGALISGKVICVLWPQFQWLS